MNDYTTPGANETHEVEHTVYASAIREGDLLSSSAGWRRVETAKLGTKWVHLTFSKGASDKLDAGSEVLVSREELTEAAKKIRDREHAVRSLARKLDGWRETGDSLVLKSLAEATQQVTAERRYQLGSQLDYLVDVAVERQRADLRLMAVRMFDDEESSSFGDVAATFARLEAGLKTEILNHDRYGRGPLSRSTSMTSNLGEDISVHEKRRLLDELEWDLISLSRS